MTGEYSSEEMPVEADGTFGTSLAEAALRGYMDDVSLLLDRRADVDVVGGKYGTALVAAAFEGRMMIVSLLLDKGANINMVGSEYGAALAAAAFKGNMDIVSLLLGRGADIDVVGGKYGTALAAAAFEGRMTIVSLLLDKGANINLVGSEYGTALAAAAFKGNINIVSLLLDRGADVDVVGGKYGTALTAAAFEGRIEIVPLMLDRAADINMVGGEYGTALAAAAFKGNMDIVSLLLDRAADTDVVGGKYGTALAAAAFEGRIEVVSLVLDRGAKIDMVGGEYGTALAAAAFEGRIEIMTLMLDRGANINMGGGEYGTVLATAALKGRMKIVSLLLDQGVDVNMQGGEYGTALAAAAFGEHMNMISLLLDRGANINVVSGTYGTALSAATFKGNQAIVSLLLGRGANINMGVGKYGTALAVAVFGGSTDMVSLLLEHGAHVGGSTFPSALDVVHLPGSKADQTLVALLESRNQDGPQHQSTNPNVDRMNAVISQPPFPMPYIPPSISSYDTLLTENCADGNITPELADVPCRNLNNEVLCRSLAALIGLHKDTIQAKHQWMRNDTHYFVSCNFDFGLAYAAARVAWKDFDSVDSRAISTQRYRWHKHAQQLLEERLKAVEVDHSSTLPGRQDLISSPYSVMPRRLWDLKSNRVVDFHMLHAFQSTIENRPTVKTIPIFWAVSHSWTSDMPPVSTAVNQHQWLIPLPENIGLDDVRSELLTLGAEYIWLDVVCIRQNSEGTLLRHLQWKEWRLDMPTIGNIYRMAAKIVRYFNGLGVPFSKEGWDDPRHWLQRARTLQEIAQEKTTINGGIPRRRDQGRAPVPVPVPTQQEQDEQAQHEQDEQAQHEQDQGPLLNSRGKVNGKTIKLRDAIRPVIQLAAKVDSNRGCEVYELAKEMTKRHASYPADKTLGLFYLLRTTKLPCYDAHMTGEDFWRRNFHLLPVERKVEILFDFPYRGKDSQGEDNQWFPTWEQVLAWPIRDPALDHKRSQSKPENMKDIPEEVAVFMSNIYTIPEAKFYRTSQPSEYEVAIGSRVFDFYLPYLSQDPISIERGQRSFTLAALDFGHEYNWVVCIPCGRRSRKDIAGLSGAGQVSVLKKVGLIRTDACSELESLSLVKKMDCLFI